MARALLPQAGADAIPLEKGLADLGLRLEPKEMKTTGIVVEAVNAEFTPTRQTWRNACPRHRRLNSRWPS